MTAFTVRGTVTDRTGSVAQWSAAADVAAAAAPLIGVDWSTATNPEPNYFTDWQARRVYSLNQATAAAATGVKALAVTDDPTLSATGGTAAATTLKNALEAFYYGTGSTARKNITYHFAARNEIDTEYQSGTLPAGVVSTHAAYRAAIDTLNPDGSKRYPLASLWIDATYWQMKTNGAAARFQPVAQYLDGWACSLYNPEREASPVGWPSYASFADLMLNIPQSWGLKRWSIWETGSPVASSGDLAVRPAWFEGLLDYVTAGCVARGMTPELYLYWNRQTTGTTPGPANQFKHDRSTAPLDTATRWRNWTY